MSILTRSKTAQCLEIIENKKDPDQITFRCDKFYYPFWKAVLRYRYVTDLPSKGFSTSWKDYHRENGHLIPLSLSYNDDKISLNHESVESVAQSTIRLDHDGSKLLVMHIYDNQNILVQGKKCRQWIAEDFERLQTIVHVLADTSKPATDNDLTKVWKMTSLISPPVSDKEENLCNSYILLDKILNQNNEEEIISYQNALTDTNINDTSVEDTSGSCNVNTFNMPEVTAINNESASNCNEIIDDSNKETNTSKTPLVSETSIFVPSNEELYDLVLQLQSDLLDSQTRSDRKAKAERQYYSTEIEELKGENMRIKQELESMKKKNQALHNKILDLKNPQLSATKNTKVKSSVTASNKQPPTPSPVSSEHLQSPSCSSNLSNESAAVISMSACDEQQSDGEWPELSSIDSDTSTLIIGDSVVSGLHQAKMNIDNERSQVLSLSGLDREQLIELLKGTAIHPNVTTVVLHVGINDCKRGGVLGKGAWRSIIAHTRRCFPKARLIMSSILPHRDQHEHITACINESNDNLMQLCHQQHIDLVNNDVSFFTIRGDIKTRWMRDALHPNNRGTSALAINIKRSFSGNIPENKHSTTSRQYHNDVGRSEKRGNDDISSWCDKTQPRPQRQATASFVGRHYGPKTSGPPQHQQPPGQVPQPLMALSTAPGVSQQPGVHVFAEPHPRISARNLDQHLGWHSQEQKPPLFHFPYMPRQQLPELYRPEHMSLHQQSMRSEALSALDKKLMFDLLSRALSSI